MRGVCVAGVPFQPWPYWPSAKMPTHKHAADAAHAVHRDGADRIVDLRLALDEPHRLDDDDSGDAAEHRGRPRLHERAGRGDRDEAGEHAVGHHPRVGLAGTAHDPEHRDDGTERRGDRGVGRDDCEADVDGDSVDAALKPNHPNNRMNVPSMAIGMW